MRVSAKSIAFGLMMTGALLAGCSSTTTSSGAVQDDVASASPSATFASEAPSATFSSPDTNEPEPSSSAVLGAAASPTSQPEPMSTDVCDTGLQYACGDIGPGGGTVFYVSATAFACGENLASMCNYLESAPNIWDPNSQSACPNNPCGGTDQNTSDFSFSGKGITWCNGPGQTQSVGVTGTAIGTGYANTQVMNSSCGGGSASQAASGYTGGGLTDWSLPSQDELQALYWYPNRAEIGGFNSDMYWSSSELAAYYGPGVNAVNAVSIYFAGGGWYQEGKFKTYGVRPVRAF